MYKAFDLRDANELMRHQILFMNILRISLILSIIFVLSCEKNEPIINPNEPDNNNSTTTVKTVIPSGDEQYLNEDSDYIFDQEKLHTFELWLPENNLEFLNNDPAREEYVEGTLVFEGDTISPVGVRYKGSIGAFVGCLSSDDWSNPSGYKTCPKLSMKVKINWEGRKEKFFKLKKLQFHSMNLDDSQMRDRLGYWLFREMGVPAPRAVHARLMINGSYSGLYSLVEQIDGRFTRYNFEDGKGNLYKEIWLLHSNGQPFPESVYIENLKTNEDENPTAELIRTFAQEVANASEADLQSVIGKWMNIDNIIAYAAVDRTIRNDDGAFHWYCTGSVCAPHNFFWYEEPNNKKLHLIPWDLDNAFENIITDSNPVTPIADRWGATQNNCQPFSYGFFGLTQKSAACDKLTGGWASFEDLYEEKLEFLKNGPLSEAVISAQLNAWEDQIRQATIDARVEHEDAISTARWQNALNQLKNQLNYARNN